VEPVLGIIKAVLGFRQFRLRGCAKVSLEWTLLWLGMRPKAKWFICRFTGRRSRSAEA